MAVVFPAGCGPGSTPTIHVHCCSSDSFSGSSRINGNGPPSAAPSDPSEPATYWDVDADVSYAWDASDQSWHSGLIEAEAELALLPAGAWTRIPSGGLSTIESYRVFYGANHTQELANYGKRDAASDGWPEMSTLSQYADVKFSLIGRVLITP